MAKLYELTEALNDFELEIDEETGEVLNVDDLDQLQLERDEKVENVALFIKNLLADAEAYKREKESFAKKQQVAMRKAESLKEYLAHNLDGEKFKSDRVTITYRRSESVEVTDLLALPPDLYYTEFKPDKAAIKKAIKCGEVLEGAELVEKTSIQIK